MKFKTTLLTIVILISLVSCQKDDPITEVEPEFSIIGKWVSEYELMNDGTKKFDNPYALLEFEYSYGFILKENRDGNSIWNDKINEDFKWEINDSNSKITITTLESPSVYEYKITILTNNTILFETPKGHKYFMTKNE